MKPNTFVRLAARLGASRSLRAAAVGLVAGAGLCVAGCASNAYQGQAAGTAARATSVALVPPAPLREFRGLWVATVANIDWPSAPGLSSDKQRAEALAILDKAKALNFNAIVLQVRSSCDAIYPSAIEPWSEFLTGQSGQAPAPMYDPLEFWVAEAHKRGLELHAWFNPFRARHFQAKKPDAASHVTIARKDIVRTYGEYLWLDPGEQSAQDYSLSVINDVVKRYNIDGVHFDDYFYPYPKAKLPFPDDSVYAAYKARSDGKSVMDKDAWRRDNIDRFVQRVYREVKAAKPQVLVGISPFGIWRPGNPPSVKGFDAFAQINADSRKWLVEGWCDYMSPQLYWKVEAPEQRFDALYSWWSNNNPKNRHLWPGIYVSRILAANAAPKVAPTEAGGAGGASRASWEPVDIMRQLEITSTKRAPAGAPAGVGTIVNTGPGTGAIHFSAVALMQNRRGLADALRVGPYAQAALSPASPWLVTDVAPLAPVVTFGGKTVRWQHTVGGSAARPASKPTVQSTPRWWWLSVRKPATIAGAQPTWTGTLLPPETLSLGVGSALIPAGSDAVSIQAVDWFNQLSAPAGTLLR